MNFNDLIIIYENAKVKYKKETYRYISQILNNAKELHKKDFKGGDHEQSWRAFKGKNLEKLIEYIITDEIKKLGLEIVNGNILERTLEKNLDEGLCNVKRNLYIDYGEFGAHLPDVDIIIYQKKTFKIIAVLS